MRRVVEIFPEIQRLPINGGIMPCISLNRYINREQGRGRGQRRGLRRRINRPPQRVRNSYIKITDPRVELSKKINLAEKLTLIFKKYHEHTIIDGTRINDIDIELAACCIVERYEAMCWSRLSKVSNENDKGFYFNFLSELCHFEFCKTLQQKCSEHQENSPENYMCSTSHNNDLTFDQLSLLANKPLDISPTINNEDEETIVDSSLLNLKKILDQRTCKVCFDGEANIMLVPCGHLSICQTCAEKLFKQCPICKVAVEKAIMVQR